MQPMYIQPVGSVTFSKSRSGTSPQNTTQIVFSSSSATVCMYDLHKVECFRESPSWTRQFTWIPALHLRKLLENVTDSPGDLCNWHIVKVMFVNTSTTARQSLAVILVNISHNRSLVCFFRSLSSTKCIISILIHGVLTTLEWLPLVDMTYKTLESHSLTSTTMDMDNEDTTIGVSKISVLSVFDGCFALGFQQGLVALLDLCLSHNRDEKQSDKPEMSIAVERSQCLNCVSCKQPISQSFKNSVEHALVYLDASVLRWNDFTYKSVSGKTLSSIPSAGVYVSALSYIPQVQGLAVGFNFGGWQLWSLNRLNMEFCLRQATPATPVVNFSFLEPSDDPRYCCFIWVGWQSSRLENESGVFKFTGKQDSSNFQNPTVKLFQLSYRRRYELVSHKHKGYNFYYQELIGIAERLSTTLSGNRTDDTKPQYPSTLLSVQSLHGLDDFIVDNSNHPHPHHYHHHHHSSVNHSIGTIRLIAFMWKFSESIIRIGLFDLDRWYHAQMPTYIRSDNTFIAIFDTSIPVQKAQLLHTYLIESSLMSFWSRVVQRESSLIKCCEAYPPSLVYPASKFSSNGSVKRMSIVNGAAGGGGGWGSKRPRPIPEVFLRPSSLSFHCLVLWTDDAIAAAANNNTTLNFSFTATRNPSSQQHQQYDDCLYNLSRIAFTSRQEECLLQLSKYQKKQFITTDNNNNNNIIGKCAKFNIIDWLSEAWSSGLLDSPGLDVIDDDEFANLLNYVRNTFSGSHLWHNSNELGVSLAYGDDYDKEGVMNSVEKLMSSIQTKSEMIIIHGDANYTTANTTAVVNDGDNTISSQYNSGEDNDFIISGKRRRISYAAATQSTRKSLYNQKLTSSSSTIPLTLSTTKKTSCQYSLNPCWVLLANCLLEHGCINILKNLEKLTPPGQESPINVNFKYSWIWLRFCRLKSRFDKLTSPLFMSKSTGEKSAFLTSSSSITNNHSAIPDLLELGCTLNQIQLLATLAKHWFNSTTHSDVSIKSFISENPVQLSIETYLSYAKLVVFLFRLGILPQTSNEEFCDSRMNSTVLQSYNSSVLSKSINDLRNTRLMSNQPNDDEIDLTENATNQLTTTISEYLLHSALQSSLKLNSNGGESISFTQNEVYNIWKEQEQLITDQCKTINLSSAPIDDGDDYENMPTSQSIIPDWLTYPPRNIQSLCALWQIPCNEKIKRSRLAILGFLLCDTAAETFLIHYKHQHYNNNLGNNEMIIDTDDINSCSTNVNKVNKCNTVQIDDNVDCKSSEALKALKMCRYVMSLFVKAFPSAYSLIPTIISLWLMDRGYFQESISPHILSFIINSSVTQVVPVSSNCPVYKDLFPNQINIMINLFKHYGRSELIGDLLKYLTINTPTSIHHQLSSKGLFNFANTNATTNNSSKSDILNMKPIGAPYLALSKLRNLVQKLNRLHNCTPLPADMLTSVDRLARDSLIQLAEICRQAGRLTDLIGLGLNIWEAKVLFEYYQKTGQHNLLFHCLIARSQYETAMAIFKDCRRTGVLYSSNNKSKRGLFGTSSGVMDNEQRRQLQLMAQLLNSCLPLINTSTTTTTAIHDGKTEHFKALANEYISMDDFLTNSESSSLINNTNGVDDKNPSYNAAAADINNNNFMVHDYVRSALPGELKKSSKKCTANSLTDSIIDTADTAAVMIDIGVNNKSNAFLLASNKKYRQEFWNLFKELKSLNRSCGLNPDLYCNDRGGRLMDCTASSSVVNNNTGISNITATTPGQPVTLNESRVKFSRKREFPCKEDDISKQLLKCIYTPPSCGRKQLHANSASSSRIISSESLFNDLKSTPVNQKPTSILKTRPSILDKGRSMPVGITTTTTTTVAFTTTITSSISSQPTVYSAPSSSSSLSLSSFSEGYISSSTTCTATSSTSSTLTTTSSSSTVDKPIPVTKENYLPKDDTIVSSHNYKVVSGEDDDCDITLNLSTVCPSSMDFDYLEGKSSLSVNNDKKRTDFTFSAPRRISLKSSTIVSDSKNNSTTLKDKKEFIFSSPLIRRTVTHVKQVDIISPGVTASTDDCDDMSIVENLFNSDHITPSEKYFIETSDALLTQPPIITSSKIRRSTVITPINEKQPDKETTDSIDEDISRRVTRSYRTRDIKTPPKLSPDKLTTEALFDQLDRLNEERFRRSQNPTTDVDDFDDTSSIASSVTDSSETPRRSTRRVKRPQRFDPSAV
ncbi:unnamed protein product [Trichobilharzia szidati]|nr:unnamed protein product [Trichobilharzia szidati]